MSLTHAPARATPARRERLLVAGGSFLGTLTAYAATLAPGLTKWDAGEFLAAIKTLGIPHPPGTPLFVLVAHVWARAIAPLTGFAAAVNLFSAFCTAAAAALLADLVRRWTGDAIAACAAAVTAGLTSSVWLNATETEVYGPALLAALVTLWAADRAAVAGERRWTLLAAYSVGLSWALHLTALLTVPAALCLLWSARRLRTRDLLPSAAIALLGASVVLFLIVRARHDPAINQGNPTTWSALSDVLNRAQYAVAPPWPRRAPLWLQLGNVIEYADWQFALGVAPDPPPSWLRTPVTILFALLGVTGSVVHRRRDRRSWRACLILFLTTTLGVVIYLNLLAGPSFGYGILPQNALREARERDYFFVFAFVCWATWSGVGAAALARTGKHRRPWLALALPIVPLTLNWRTIVHERRNVGHSVERDARTLLARVPPNGVYLAIGDNDTYPLWYLQTVLAERRDVTVVTIPLLGPAWYRAELARRHALLPPGMATTWYGVTPTLDTVRARAAANGRPVIGPLPPDAVR